MAKQSTVTNEIPPYPPLAWDTYFWTGTFILNAWKGFQCRLGSYGAKSSPRSSHGESNLTIRPPIRNSETPPSSDQTVAYRYLVHNQEAIRDAILHAVFDQYPDYRAEHYALHGLQESDKTLPVLKRAQQLRDLIGLSRVLIQDVFLDGSAYVGYEFGCCWDEEHGLGVMMHQDRIVSIGGADVSILEWIAERDARKAKKRKKDSGSV